MRSSVGQCETCWVKADASTIFDLPSYQAEQQCWRRFPVSEKAGGMITISIALDSAAWFSDRIRRTAHWLAAVMETNR